MNTEMKREQVQEIPINKIDEFEGHPFLVKDDEDMARLVESIKLQGQLVPAVVRPKEDGRYELISGHRRKRACELAGWDTLKCEVKKLRRDEAIIYMTDANIQRSSISIKEKAKMYKMRYDALDRLYEEAEKLGDPMGPKLAEMRGDPVGPQPIYVSGDPLGPQLASIIGDPSGPRMRKAEILAKESKDSMTQIKRYIRLNKLIPELLDMVDTGAIGMRPGVEISFLPEYAQEWLLHYINEEQATPSHDQAIRLRKAYEAGELNKDKIADMMKELKPNQKESVYIKSNKIMELFPEDLPISKREEYIMSAMKNYRRIYEKQKADRAREDDMER